MRALLIALVLAGGGTPMPDAVQLHDRIARQWAQVMRPDGSFRDPYDHRVMRGYGTVLIAGAIVEAAGRREDPRLRQRALRAAAAAASRDPRRGGVFEQWGMARLYIRLRDARIPGSATELAALRAWLRRVASPYVDPRGGECYRAPSCYSNHEMVEAAADRQLLATGLSSTRRGTKLHDRRRLALRVERFLDGVSHAFRRGYTDRGPRAGLLADTGAWPVAYHALSTMFLAQLVTPGSPRRMRATLARAREAICLVAGPDGDLSYNGAREGQAWVPAMGLAALAGASPCQAVDHALWQRLLAHGFGRVGLNPALRFREGARAYDSLDGDAVTTNGLVLAALSQVAASGGSSEPAFAAPSWYSLPAPGWAIARTRSLWLAVRSRARFPSSPRSAADLRYDAGMAALKYRVGGAWHDLLRPRPRTAATDGYTGPVLLGGGEPLIANGRLSHHGRSVIATGRFEGRFGTRGRRFRIVYRVAGDGVRASMRVRGGERVRLGFFVPAGAYVAHAGRIATYPATITVSPARAFHVSATDGGCCDRRLDAAYTTVPFAGPGRLVWAVRASGTLRMLARTRAQ